ncbi:MAG: hypothetical protein JWN61_1087 [Pseudonocardiales bacterium]|nr:hypothetical protein [Pseudonocardiales bacterium]
MRQLEVGALIVVVLLGCAVAVIITRRNYLLRGSGGISLALRAAAPDLTSGRPSASGASTQSRWALGLGRFNGDELRWYRLFGLAIKPRYVLHRSEIELTSRRAPQGPEIHSLPADAVILECRHGQQRLELAVVGTAATGLSSWLESAAPDVGL